MPTREHRIGRLTWDEAGERLAAGACAVLPVGAGGKQHGLHMPMMTDQLIVDYFADVLVDAVGGASDALIWPTLTYGYFPAFIHYCGHASLSVEVFEAVIGDLVTGLHRDGARSIFILDAGLSTRGPIERALARRSSSITACRLGVFDGPCFLETAARLKRQAFGSHADEIETSLMLRLYPGQVDSQRAMASPGSGEGSKPGPLEPFDRRSPNFAPSGSFGDPTLACQETGTALVSAIAEDLTAGAVAALRKLPR